MVFFVFNVLKCLQVDFPVIFIKELKDQKKGGLYMTPAITVMSINQ